MIQVVYGDVLLLIDFCMNFFVLYTTALLLHRKTQVWSLASAAIIGGVYSVAKVFVNGNDVLDCVISLGVGALMCYITFGGYRYLKTLLVFFGTAATVGGIMFGVYFLLGSYHADLFGNFRSYAYSHIPLWLFTLLAAISFLLSWLFSYLGKEVLEKKEENVVMEYAGRSMEFTLLLDSGNLAKEPISGKNVVLINSSKAKSLFPEELYSAILQKQSEYLLRRKFRLVSICGIGGNKIVCYGFFPDKMFFKRDGHIIDIDACVAVCAGSVCDGELDGIAHPILFS